MTEAVGVQEDRREDWVSGYFKYHTTLVASGTF